MRRSRFKPRKPVKVGRRAKKPRRVHVATNQKACDGLFVEAKIRTTGSQHARKVLETAATRLDDVELDTALKAALRGDYQVATSRLLRTVTQVSSKKRRKKGWTPWRLAIVRKRW